MLNIVQTFYVDAGAVQNADNISITAADLYFKAKPDRTTNETGIVNPGVTVGVCTLDASNNVTILGQVRLEYDRIYDSSSADAITTATFTTPINVPTNQSYGIVILPEDGGYDVWINKAGDRITGTNDPSGGPTTNKNGKLYSYTGTSASNEVLNAQLKFGVNIAKYTQNSTTIDLVNEKYEFLAFSNRVNVFTGGEYVFANTVPFAGTINVTDNSDIITGVGTTFTNLQNQQPIVITSGANSQIVAVASITNATSMTVNSVMSFTNTAATFRNGIIGKVVMGDYVANKLVLTNSSATNTAFFSVGQQVTGSTSQSSAIITAVEDLPVDKFVAHIEATTTISGTITATYSLAYSNGSTYIVGGSYDKLVNGQQQTVDASRRYILSRSHEVVNNYLYNNNKSAITKITLTSSNDYAAPVLNDRSTDIIVYRNQVSNAYMRAYANGVTYDSEVTPNGVALAKHITKKMTFDNQRKAEDLVVYASAYRPAGTDIRFYARIYNTEDSDAFDDKLWTPLVYDTNADLRSAVDSHQILEYKLGLPAFPDTDFNIPLKFTTSANSAVVTAVSGSPNSYVGAGAIVKIYNELFPSNYMVTSVNNANTTAITLNQRVTDNSVLGSGQVIDVLEFGQTAFNNKGNFNVARYFNSTGGAFDTFNTVQIKAVLLADNTNVVPEIDQIEVLGVSA